MRIDLQQAYILHARPYRDTSLMLDLLTPDYGKVTVVARGVRKSKSPKRQLLNPFNRLLVTWQGQGGVKLLTAFEEDGLSLHLQSNFLYAGFYLNELLVKLLPELDPHDDLYQTYQHSLVALQREEDLEPILRSFEFRLLDVLGYGLNFCVDCRSGLPIEKDQLYECKVQEGFFMADEWTQAEHCLRGEWMLSIDKGDYAERDVRRAAKYLTRRLIKPLLGRQVLHSRALFVPPTNPSQ